MRLAKLFKKIFKNKISILLFIVLPLIILFGIIWLRFVSSTSDSTAYIKEERVVYLYEQNFEDESYIKPIFSAHNVERNGKLNYLHPSEFNKKGEVVFKIINPKKDTSFYVIPQFILLHRNSFFKLLISQDNENYQLFFSKDGKPQFYYGSPVIKLPQFEGTIFIKIEMYVDDRYAKELWDAGLLSVEFFARKWAEKRYKSPNIVLFVLDTLRADHLSCYGYKRRTTPNIDKFCKDGVVFYNAFSQGNHTIPSVASLITSRYSSDALEYSNKDKPISDIGHQMKTLAEVLRVNGYTTAEFTANQLIARGNRGFTQGYDYITHIRAKKDDAKGYARAKAVNQVVFDWLREHSGEKFFLYIQTMDAHQPYVPFSPYNHMFDPNYDGDLLMTDQISPHKKQISDRDLEYLISLYDGEIRYADYYFNEFIEFLHELDLLEDTLIIVTSDHGQQFYEHGMYAHGWSMHDEEIHVPLIMRYPKRIPKNKKIYDMVELMGIAPTILDMAEIGIPRCFKGKSLLELVMSNKRAEEDDYAICSEGLYAVSIAVRNSMYKFIKLEEVTEDAVTRLGMILNSPGGKELYDLINDPDEMNNIYSDDSIIAHKLEKELHNRLNMEHLQSPIILRREEIPPNIIRQLKALGYIQ